MAAAGSVARPDGAPRMLVAGSPAAVRKELTGHAAWWSPPRRASRGGSRMATDMASPT